MKRWQPTLLSLLAAFLMAPVTTRIPASVVSLAELETAVEAGNDYIYIPSTISYDVDPNDGSCPLCTASVCVGGPHDTEACTNGYDCSGCETSGNTITQFALTTTPSVLIECGPGVEIRYNNVNADLDTDNELYWGEFVVPSGILPWKDQPYPIHVKNCTVVEYKGGVRCDPSGVVGDVRGGDLGSLGGWTVHPGAGAIHDEAKSVEIIYDNTKFIACSVGSEMTGSISAAATHIRFENGSYVFATIPVLAKTNCTSCDEGMKLRGSDFTLVAQLTGICAPGSTDEGEICEDDTDCAGGGSGADVTAVADSATNPGTHSTVTITSAHGMSDGDYVTLDLTPNTYDGTYEVSAATTYTIDIEEAYVATATGSWDGGVCIEPNNPRAIKHEGDTAISFEDFHIAGQIEYSTAGSPYGARHTNVFSNGYFRGPGVGAEGKSLFFFQEDEETLFRAVRLGDLFTEDQYAEVFQIGRGDVTGDLHFEVCNEVWESGGAHKRNSLVDLVAAPTGPISYIDLDFTGPAGCGPGRIISSDGLLGIADEDTTGHVSAGLEYGRIDFSAGEIVAPPGCHYSTICAGDDEIDLDEDFNGGDGQGEGLGDIHYVGIDDCAVSDTATGAEGILQAGAFMPTKICGFYPLQGSATGSGDTWTYTIMAGPSGSLEDTSSSCANDGNLADRCHGGPGVLDPGDEVVMKITPTGNPTDNTVEFIVWYDTDLE